DFTVYSSSAFLVSWPCLCRPHVQSGVHFENCFVFEPRYQVLVSGGHLLVLLRLVGTTPPRRFFSQLRIERTCSRSSASSLIGAPHERAPNPSSLLTWASPSFTYSRASSGLTPLFWSAACSAAISFSRCSLRAG